MKKNLRIVSAAAAALLAVAPVAASATVANAAVTVNGTTASTDTSVKADGTVTVNLAVNASDNTTVSDAEKSVKVSVEGATLGALAANNADIKIGTLNNGTFTEATGNLKAGTQYVIQISNFKLTGLTTGKTYDVKGGSVSATKNANNSYDASALDGQNLTFTSDSFQVYDTKQTGTVSFMDKKNNIVANGSVDLGTINTVSGLATAITDKYVPTVANGNATVSWNTNEVQNAVEEGLKKAGITLTGTGASATFNAPASSFKVSVPATAGNGKTANFEVTVNVDTKNSTAPTFSAPSNANGLTLNPANNDKSAYDLKLDVDATTTAKDIASQFTASYKGSNGSTTSYNTPVNVKSSNLNTAVAGKYTVVLEAVNPSTNAKKEVTVNVTVGDPGEVKTVQAGSETAKVVNINGNTVSETSDVLANGAKVATYGTVDVNGVSYTRLNSKYSDKYVQTKYVDGSIKEEKSESTMIMYKSAIYNKDGKNTGKDAIGGYTNKDLVVDEKGNLKVYTINGETFYKIAGADEYVRARNVTGSKMTLKHNAYVYKSNGKRANKKVLKKNSTITVYGGKYKAMKGYKKDVLRIGVNQYVKLANVKKYELAK